MATKTVGIGGDFATIAAALASGQVHSGDTIQLQPGYTEAGTVSVTIDSLTFTGDATNTGIHLALATGINMIQLLGTAPFRVDDNAGNNLMNGNDSGVTLQVSGGSDNTNQGVGNDTLIVDYHASATAVNGGVDANDTPTGFTGTISDGAGNSVHFTGVENFNITTGSGDDNLHLGDAAGGNDVVSLGIGNDTVYSGRGIDQIDGGSGNDGWAADMSSQTGNINIDLTAPSSTFLTIGSVTGIEYLGGDNNGALHQFATGSGDDTIVTTSGNFRDAIYTNGGNDTITVAGGGDFVNGGTGNDRLIIDYHTSTTGMTGGVDGNDAPTGYSGTITDGAGNQVQFQSIESFTITTGSGDDSLHLGEASGGNDVVSLGSGADFVYSGTGIDQIDGGTGNDTWAADMSSETAAINIDLNASSSTFLTTGSVTGVEALGGDNSSLHFFNTGSGDDTIVTLSGNFQDNIRTNGGSDTITVAGGNDRVDGGSGNDRLIVDYHTSTTAVTGGADGNDSPTGYNGTISDGASSQVHFDRIENFTITTGSGDDSLHLGDFSGGDDVVSLGSGTDFVYSGTGIDQIDGGTGNDTWAADMSSQTAGISIDLNTTSTFLTTGSVTGVEALGGDGGSLRFFNTGSGDDTIVTRTDLNLADNISAGGGNDTVTIGGTTGSHVIDHADGGTGRDRLIVDYSTTTNQMNGDFASGGSLVGGYSGDISIPSVQQLVGESGFEDFTVKTGSGDDTIQTGDGNDVISSGGGNDAINTRGGVDQVDGGGGTDSWLADMSAAVAGENISINLNNTSSSFTVGGVTGSVTGIESLGGFGGNTFKTGAGDDVIVTRTDLNIEDDIATGDGDDTVTIGGTTGATVTDHVDGGVGRDRLIVDYSTTTNQMNGDFASGGSLVGGYSGDISIPSVQQLVGESGFEDFTVKTGSGDDTIQTGDGNDVISSGSGNDAINTRGGVDQVDGGGGTDSWLANMSAAVAGENISINLNNTSSSFTVGGVTGSVTGIESLGGFGGNTFKTGAGDDTIATRSDLNLEDDISTGDGNDTVTVGGTTGANVTDHVDGGAGRDRLIVDYHTTSNNIANNLAASGSLAGGYSGDLSRPGILQIVSSAGFEDFTVSTGSGDDNFSTGDGDDILNAGTGNDIVHANGGTDRLVVDYSATSNAVTVNNLTGDVTNGYSGSVTDGTPGFTVTFDGIENFTITGGSGNDSITTGDGDDVLRGGVGQDALHGAGGADTLIAALGDIASGDVFDGGTGTDTLQVTGTVDFTGATLTSIEALLFATSGTSTATFTAPQLGSTNLSSTLAVTGDANANQIVVNIASAGTVDLSGWTFTNWIAASDTVTVNGSAGVDTIVGSSQNDVLNGGGADDSITGGAGNDTIDGGAGNHDTIVYTGARNEYTATSSGSDIILTDTVNGRDGSDTIRNVEYVTFSNGTFAINTPPTLAAIPTAASTERTFAILNSTASVSDAQLDALNSASGDYSGASLTISRHLGPNAEDDFGFGTSANFTVVGSTLQAGGQTFATFTNAAGTLTITFANGGATPSTTLVNDVLQHITYANENHNPVSQVTLDWAFNDGETTDFGGALIATQSQTVNITGLNDAPVNTVPSAQTVAEDATLTITGLAVSDADSGVGTITTTLSAAHGTVTVAAGAAGGLTSGQISGSGTASVTLTGTVAQINATLAAANSVHYSGDADFNGSDALTVTTNDNFHSGTSTANLIVNPGAEAGSLGGAPTGWTTDGGPIVEDYATFGGLTAADSSSVGGGALYFTGGNVALSTTSQVIDVTSYATKIDAGEATANLSGYIGGFESQSDATTLVAHFIDGSSNELGSFSIGGVTPADRLGITELLFREGSLLMPVGTRSIELDLTTTRTEGTANDGYADNLSLTLSFAEKDTDTVAITVTEVNDAPVAHDDPLTSVVEDSGQRTISFATLTGNDDKGAANESGQTLTVINVTGAVGGTVVISGTDVLFTPTVDFNGTAGFDYTVTDNGTTNGGADPKTATAHVSFAVTEVNDAPIAAADTLTSVAEDSGQRTISFATLTGNDHPGPVTATDESGQTLTVTNVTGAVGGTVSLSGGNVLFTPTADFNGTAGFDYTVTDNGTTAGGADPKTATAHVSFTVTPVADTPSVTNATTSEETRTTSGLVISRNAVDGAEVTNFKITGITNGLLFQNDGTTAIHNGDFITFAQANVGLKFTPATDLNSPAGDTFSFDVQASTSASDTGLGGSVATATITVSEVNDAPIAAADTLSSIAEDSGQRTISGATLTGNDHPGPATATDESGQTLTVTNVTGAVGGTVSISGGNVLFTPTADFNGTAGFDYTVTDNGTTAGGADPKTATAHVSFTVTPVADTPSVTNATTSEETRTTSGLVISRNAVDGAEVTNFKITGITNGLLFQNDGTTAIHNGDFITFAQANVGLKFTPATDLNSPAGDTFSFDVQASTSASDTGLGGSVATATITVSEVNDAPIAAADTLSSIAEDSGQRTISGATLTGNDHPGPATATDESGQTLTVTNVTGAVGGTVSISGGNVLFTPTADFNGTAGFDYTVTDNGTTAGGADPKTATAHVSFTVTPVADTPSVTNATTSEETRTTSGLVISRNAVDGAEVTNFKITGITNGLLFQNDGTTAIHNGDFITFAQANVGLKFTPATDLNSPAGDTFSFDVQASTSASDTGLGGSVATATITVSEVNDAPIAAADTLSSIAEDSGQRTISGATLTGNDHPGPATATDESGQTLTVTNVTGAVGGTVSISGGNVLFTPTADFNGTASFDYTVTDNGTTNGIASPQTATAHVTFAVTALDDAPTATNLTQSLTLTEDVGTAPKLFTAAPVVGDVDSASVTATLTLSNTAAGVLNGAGTGVAGVYTIAGTPAAVSAALAAVTFAPAADFNGSASVTVAVSDGQVPDQGTNPSGTVSITVTEVNDAPVAASDTLTSVAEDSGQRTISFATLTGNDHPGPITATDESGQTLTVTNVTNAVGGTVSISGSNVLFTPNPDFNGTAGFDYTVSDNGTTNGGADPKTATAHVSFAVTALDDAPTATNLTQSLTLAEDVGAAPKLFTAAPVVGDIDSASVTATLTLSNTAAGALNGAGTGVAGVYTIAGTPAAVSAALAAVTFTPATDFNGTANVTVAVSDGQVPDQGTNPSGTVSITITEVNDAPIAAGDTLSSVAEDSSQRTISFASLTGNDSKGPANESAQTLTITGVSNAVGGTVSISGSNVLFTPGANFNGTASFDYTVTDNGTTHGSADPKSATGHASFSVTAVNDPVQASAPATLTVAENHSATVSGLSISDVDATLAPSGIYEVSLAAGHGTLTLASLTGLTFTAGDGTADAAMTFHGTLSAIDAALATASYAGATAFSGSDSISFSATDTFGGIVATGTGAATSDSHTIAVTVTPGAQPPTDFNGDGFADVLWRESSGEVAIWGMNGTQIVSNQAVATPDHSWHIEGVGDFDADHHGDVLLRNDSGQVVIWQLNGAQIAANQSVATPDSSWHVNGVGDFDGDGHSDVLWRSDSGQVVIWGMNGSQIVSNQAVATPGNDWHVQGVADFDGDGKSDVLWRNDSGQVAIWGMNGAQIATNQAVATPDHSWHIVGTGDFNGDSHADVLWRNDSGQVVIWEMNGSQIIGNAAVAAPDNSWHVQDVLDLNGDQHADILWRNDSGQVVAWEMNGTQIIANQSIAVPGSDWTVATHHYDLI